MLMAATVAVWDFGRGMAAPDGSFERLDLWLLDDLLNRVQAVAILLDLPWHHRRPEIEAVIRAHPHLQATKIIDSPEKWRASRFREPLLRALDDIRPDFVLQPDSDESFGPGFDEDFAAFVKSKRDMMMFQPPYEMPTIDGSWVPFQPRGAHAKVYHWRPGLSFKPYRGFARPTGLVTEYRATSRIQHWCCWTPELQRRMVAKESMPKRSDQVYFGQRLFPPPASPPERPTNQAVATAAGEEAPCGCPQKRQTRRAEPPASQPRKQPGSIKILKLSPRALARARAFHANQELKKRRLSETQREPETATASPGDE